MKWQRFHKTKHEVLTVVFADTEQSPLEEGTSRGRLVHTLNLFVFLPFIYEGGRQVVFFWIVPRSKDIAEKAWPAVTLPNIQGRGLRRSFWVDLCLCASVYRVRYNRHELAGTEAASCPL